MRFLSVVMLLLLFPLTACSPPPPPPEVAMVDNLITFFNEVLPLPLPRFPVEGEGPSVYLAGQSGQRSYLIRPAGDYDPDRFTADTLHTGSRWDYLSFREEEEVSLRYASSVYSPRDSSRFGANAEVLEMSTRGLFKKDNPDDSGLGYLAVFLHELAHTTEKYPEPDRIPGMIEQTMVFEREAELKRVIKVENGLLLAALAAPDTAGRNGFIRDYLKVKAKRSAMMLPGDVDAERYYEFTEGYGRYVEHLMQEQSLTYRFTALEEAFGPLPAYVLTDRPWMYEVIGNDYFSVLGFNKIRLLAAAEDWRFAASLRGESIDGLDAYLQMLTEDTEAAAESL